MPLTPRKRLAIIVSHPIQYYSPWFAYLSGHLGVRLKVFYLWDAGLTQRYDPGFQKKIAWDIDLLSGHDHVLLKNTASHPGLDHFFGLNHPDIEDQLLRWQPDALLVINYPYLSHCRVIFSRRLRHIPKIFRGDSHLLAENLSWWKKIAKRLALFFLFRRFQAFLPVGQANQDYFLRHGVDPRKFFLSPHAVDNDRFFSAAPRARREARLWRKKLDIPANHAVVLFAGKFEEKKRPQDLLRAFLQANLPRTSLLLVGSGHLEAELRALAGSDPRIFFAPFQNQKAMPRVYAAADLVVLPSYGSQETWGLAINEALCLSKAVIVSDHVGCQSDLVYSGENGLVFPAGDVAALSKALKKALSNPARLKSWGKKGASLARTHSYTQTTEGLRQALYSLWGKF